MSHDGSDREILLNSDLSALSIRATEYLQRWKEVVQFSSKDYSDQQKLMQQAWEYEKKGMGLQYNYGQQAADAEYKRNLQMWKDTNFGAQRAEMEDAGLSVGLMYGNGGGQAASTAGGNATQPNAPKTEKA